MSISNDVMGFQSDYSTHYFDNKEDAVRFANACLQAFKAARTSTTAIEQAKSEGFFAVTAIIELSVATRTHYSSGEQQIT